MRIDSRWSARVVRPRERSADEIAFWQHLTATRPKLRSPFFNLEFTRAADDAGAGARVCVPYYNGIGPKCAPPMRIHKWLNFYRAQG
jgi:hypothetical protein